MTIHCTSRDVLDKSAPYGSSQGLVVSAGLAAAGGKARTHHVIDLALPHHFLDCIGVGVGSGVDSGIGVGRDLGLG